MDYSIVYTHFPVGGLVLYCRLMVFCVSEFRSKLPKSETVKISISISGICVNVQEDVHVHARVHVGVQGLPTIHITDTDVYTLLTNVYTLLSNVYTLLSNVYTLLSNVYTLLTNVYTLLSNVYTLLSNVYTIAGHSV
jgi:hypothetical protein